MGESRNKLICTTELQRLESQQHKGFMQVCVWWGVGWGWVMVTENQKTDWKSTVRPLDPSLLKANSCPFPRSRRQKVILWREWTKRILGWGPFEWKAWIMYWKMGIWWKSKYWILRHVPCPSPISVSVGWQPGLVSMLDTFGKAFFESFAYVREKTRRYWHCWFLSCLSWNWPTP